jgi:hypothetical protein
MGEDFYVAHPNRNTGLKVWSSAENLLNPVLEHSITEQWLTAPMLAELTRSLKNELEL